jgi:F-type H+-transporting ATPase subunit a
MSKILLIHSPLEQFEVINLLGLNAPIFGYFNLTLTNLGLYSILVFILVLGFHSITNNDVKLLPSSWSILLETLFASIHSMVREQIGKEIYLPFIYSLFFFILFANLIGIVPYSFTMTTSAIICISLSMTIFISVTILGLSIHKLHFFSYFIPSGTPLGLVPMLVLIELISYLSRAGSLGIRLLANICGGHILLKILSSFLFKMFTSSFIILMIALIPFPIFIAIIGLEFAICFIQAYIFTILTCIYIKDAIDLH